MNHQCKKCLLLQAGENVKHQEIIDYLLTIPHEQKVNDDVYSMRISKCTNCDWLISGMCRKCGCYVEIRARLKNKDCPNTDNKKW